MLELSRAQAAAIIAALANRLEEQGALIASAPGVLASRFCEIQSLDAIAQCLRETARLLGDHGEFRSDLEVFLELVGDALPGMLPPAHAGQPSADIGW